MPLIVRNDVDQKYKNMVFWHKLWKRLEPTADDLKCGGYGKSQIDYLSKALNLGNGKRYASLEDWLNDLSHRPVLVTIEHKKDQNGKPWPQAQSLEKTGHPDCKHVFKGAADPDKPFYTEEPIDDTELPF